MSVFCKIYFIIYNAYANSNNQQLNRALNITINNINYRVQES